MKKLIPILLGLSFVSCKPKEEPAKSPPAVPTTPAGDKAAPSLEPAAPAAPTPAAAAADVAKAGATLASASGSKVTGTVTFTKEANGVRVVADVSGLTPGDHGFHIHEKGDCSAPDASSAGGHFNPSQSAHGAPNAPAHHAGDFGNITADASGKARLDVVVDFVSLTTGDQGVIGRGVIVHEKADDMTTQPTGNAGGRQACGVIAAQ